MRTILLFIKQIYDNIGRGEAESYIIVDEFRPAALQRGWTVYDETARRISIRSVNPSQKFWFLIAPAQSGCAQIGGNHFLHTDQYWWWIIYWREYTLPRESSRTLKDLILIMAAWSKARKGIGLGWYYVLDYMSIRIYVCTYIGNT